MSVPSRAQAGLLIVGTLLAAAGLNVGVLSLGDSEPETGAIEAAAAPDPLAHRPVNVAVEATEAWALETSSPESPNSQMALPPPAVGHDDEEHLRSARSSDHDDVTVEVIDYEIPSVAEIVVTVRDGRRLELESVTPAEGWVSRIEDEDADELKVKFMRLSDGEEAEFEAEFEHGQLKVKLED